MGMDFYCTSCGCATKTGHNHEVARDCIEALKRAVAELEERIAELEGAND